jgi:extracellular elastinolytic metalloproteinase
VRRPHLSWVALVAATGALALPASALAVAQVHEHDDGLRDYDARSGAIAPTGAQRAAVKRLGAAATWNRFGTPATLSKRGKYLAKNVRGKNAAIAARTWLERNKALFRLSSTAGLVLERDSRLAFSRGHAVHFRQVFDGMRAVDGGLITVGITGPNKGRWKVAFVSSALTTDRALAGEAKLSAVEGWAAAASATDARYHSVAQVRGVKKVGDGWLRLNVAGAVQQVRKVAFPTIRAGVVPAFESYVHKDRDSSFRVVTDARTGAVLARQSAVHNVEASAQVEQNPFSGEVPAVEAACGPMHPFTVGAGVRYLDGFVAATQPLNDIVFNLYRDGTLLISADSNFSPEAFHLEPAGGVPPGNYSVQVCDFDDAANTVWSEPRTYTGRVIEDDTPAPAAYLARWKSFPSSPPLGPGGGDPWGRPSTDTREIVCWYGAAGCDETADNLAARYPWDHNPVTDTPTFTTVGNAAESAESWTHPNAPAPFQFRPVSPTRDYMFPFTDAWNASDCNTGNPSGSAFVPGVSFDVSAAAVSLFVNHNRMHDWSYYLGFTEQNWNAQRSNFGRTELFRQNDPVTGDVQAGGAIPTPTAFLPTVGSRNNANMGTAPDGLSSVTNMYFWQPQQGVFYAPCADGDYDLSLIGHEYGHMIENRMIGKGFLRAGHHAGAMGESHGDLFGMEIVNELGVVPVAGENRYAVSVYATGQQLRGIRNFGMNFPQTGAFPTAGKYLQVNPLNFSDLGYDVTGPTAVSSQQVHANGEIWSATNFRIRKLLADKYDDDFPYDDADLQRACATGELAPYACPGNRRWMQLVFDAMLLMPVNPTMLQARDAALAADLMRFGGANQRELWLGYSRSGMGRNAVATNSGLAETDTDPVPDFESPLHDNATIQFVAKAKDGGTVPARIFVGHYEARVSPIADTNPATPAAGTPASVVNLDDRAKFAPGTYEFVATAPGYGHLRFRKTLHRNEESRIELRFAANHASANKGATATGDTSGADAAAQAAQLRNLIDDTELTNWTTAGTVTSGNLSVDGKQVTVDLAGTDPVNVKRVNVSALVSSGQSRFTALRQFEIWACNDGGSALHHEGPTADCTLDSGYRRVYTAPANAFPGDAPRPVSPIMLLREFDIPNTKATHLRLVVKTNQCTGGPQFQGDQDADAVNFTDCDLNPTAAVQFVRAAELQAFSDNGSVYRFDD